MVVAVISTLVFICGHGTVHAELINDLADSFLKGVFHPIPKSTYYGTTYTTDASPFSYRYVVFDRGTRDLDLRVLEQVLSRKGYYLLGRNSSYRQSGTLRVECRVNERYQSEYSSNMRKVYSYSSRCDLKDINRDNFIVYSGQGKVYGSGDNARGQALALAFVRLNSASQLHTIPVNVKGVDNGVRSHIQKDRDEAILNAKCQALAKTGSSISNLEKYQLELSKGKITQDSYRQLIEDQSTGKLLPGFRIEDLGYINGSYTVRLTGAVVPDPIGSIETSPSPKYRSRNQYSDNHVRAINSPEINRTLETVRTGDIASWVVNGTKYKMQVLETNSINPQMPCRKYTLQIGRQRNVSTYTACRNQYGLWRNQ
uniref:hypothetical protein n=1 Tax=Candidatus Electrothrix sp. TaxID=2170559 RepID=UPI004055DDBD